MSQVPLLGHDNKYKREPNGVPESNYQTRIKH